MENNNNNKDVYVYSPLNFYSPDGNMALGFSFVLKGILQVKLAPRNGNGVGYDNNNAVSIYLSTNQAVILSQALNLFRQKLRDNQAYNVGCTNNKKTTNIVFESIPDSSGIAKIRCTINIFNNNMISKTASIDIKNDEYIVEDFDPNTMQHKAINVADVPIVMIQNLLNEYIKAMTGATAYGIHYCIGQYEYSNKKLKDKLFGNGQQQINGPQNSIFNQNNQQQSSNEFITDSSYDDFFE